MKEIQKKNYLESQKPTRSNSFSISSDLSVKVKGRKKIPILPAGYSENVNGLRQSAPVSGSMEVSREFARNPLCLSRLGGSNRELTTVPLACMTRSPTPWIYHWVVSLKWCPTTHFGSVANVLKSKVLFRRRGSIPHSSFVEVGFCSTLLKISCSIR